MTWLKTNWQKTAILLSSVALVVLAGVQAWDTYSTHCPPCPTPTPHAYDKPVAVPSSSIVLPTVDWSPPALPLPGVAALAVGIDDPAYLYPKWRDLPGGLARVVTGMAMSQFFGAGGRLFGLDAMEKERLYRVAFQYDLGFPMTNVFTAAGDGTSVRCQAFSEAIVCEYPDGAMAIREWSSGPKIWYKVTPAPSPTMIGGPPGTPPAGR